MRKVFRIIIPVLLLMLSAIGISGMTQIASADNAVPLVVGTYPCSDDDAGYSNGEYGGGYMMGSAYGGYQYRGIEGGAQRAYRYGNMMGQTPLNSRFGSGSYR